MIYERITQLRKLFYQKGINGYIIPSNDEYFCEYTNIDKKRLQFITGFSGSNGIAIILNKTALFFTDGRYIDQSYIEVDNKIFHIFNQDLIKNFKWVSYISTHDVIGFDPKLFSIKTLIHFQALNLKPEPINLIDHIWLDKPRIIQSDIYLYPEKFAGQSHESKIKKCINFLLEHRAAALLITNPESVCWLLNIRANDIKFSPLLLAHCIVTNNNIYLFIDQSRIDKNVLKILKNISIIDNNKLIEIILNINGKILYDENQCSLYLTHYIKKKSHKNITNPCLLWKACKNSQELKSAIEIHIKDSVAICEFLSFLKNNAINNYTEYDIAQILVKYREKNDHYIMDSFPPICAYRENAAFIHYKATKKSAKKLSGNGLLLIDSGGQYIGATTDITRTIAIGENLSEKYKNDYTRVLKGNIALNMIKFPKNTICGAHLDVLARQYLWNNYQDYNHSTGHGVGNFLNVHEGPQKISLNSFDTPLLPGMILSNEPGLYVPGKYGIRIENLMYVDQTNHKDFLQFNTLTMVPYAKNLINLAMLTDYEIKYLDNYYEQIVELVFPLLTTTSQNWLKHEIHFS